MPLTAAIESCDNGPCPAFRPAPGGVIVQGIKTTDPGLIPPGMPDHEGVVFIPDGNWELMISRLLAQMGMTPELLAQVGINPTPGRQ